MRRRTEKCPKNLVLEIIDKCGYAVLSMIDQTLRMQAFICVARDGEPYISTVRKKGENGYPQIVSTSMSGPLGDEACPLINSPPNTSQPSSQAMPGSSKRQRRRYMP